MPEYQPTDIRSTPWPSVYDYALAHRCPVCGAQPFTDCHAPQKNARLAHLPGDSAPAARMHAARQDAGLRHYHRDLARAPWPEDREAGRRYDTLPAAPDNARELSSRSTDTP